MSTEVAVAKTLDQEKIELIKQTVAKGATDLELELFLHACNRTGLDPLMKQLYAIKRWSQADGREVMSFQTGIDGLRLIADRTKLYAGSDDAIFSGVVKEDDFKASVTVWKLVNGERCPFTASARWPEYVQKKKDGTPTKFWMQMPFGQLGKCAESLALRKAFPMELSGLYSDEEMVHLDSEWKPQIRTGAEMLAEMENNPPIDAAAPRGGKPSQEEGLANETVKSGGQSKGSIHESAVEEVIEEIKQSTKELVMPPRALQPVESVWKDIEQAPDYPAKYHIFNEAIAQSYPEHDKKWLMGKMKGTKK